MDAATVDKQNTIAPIKGIQKNQKSAAITARTNQAVTMQMNSSAKVDGILNNWRPG